MEFEEVGRIMQNEKARIVRLNRPFTLQLQGTFRQVGDNTQNSVFLQQEIRQFTTEIQLNTAGKNLTNPGAAFITHRVHGQRATSLCVSFATTTTVRGASINYLTNHGHPEDQIRNELENDFQFSFTKMLTIFTGCISPRSLDGLIINSRNDPHFMNAQAQLSGKAIDRLVNKTALEENGWKRMNPLVRLFNQYNVDPNNIDAVL